jgi:hypothetical protein
MSGIVTGASGLAKAPGAFFAVPHALKSPVPNALKPAVPNALKAPVPNALKSFAVSCTPAESPSTWLLKLVEINGADGLVSSSPAKKLCLGISPATWPSAAFFPKPATPSTDKDKRVDALQLRVKNLQVQLCSSGLRLANTEVKSQEKDVELCRIKTELRACKENVTALRNKNLVATTQSLTYNNAMDEALKKAWDKREITFGELSRTHLVEVTLLREQLLKITQQAVEDKQSHINQIVLRVNEEARSSASKNQLIAVQSAFIFSLNARNLALTAPICRQ